jgi:primosomal protein N' (replication factor Y)
MRGVNGSRGGEAQGALFGDEPEGPFAGVVLNRPLEQVYSYRVPERLRGRVDLGARVRVPLGRGNAPAVGYCVTLDDAAPAGVHPAALKDVLDVLDEPPLIDAPMRELTRWLASYYLCAWGQALDAVVPAGVKKAAGTRLFTCLVLPDGVRDRPDPPDLSAKQRELMAVVRAARVPLTVTDACRLAKCQSIAPIAALRKRGLVHTVKRRLDRVTLPEDDGPAEPPRPPVALTDEQRDALAAMQPALAGPSFATFLLHGVTGSGKTEVYLGAIDRVVAAGREAIVLVPEISLTPQTIRRFKRRFPRVAVLHSHLADVERHRHWKAIAAGEVQVVVGARSAVFAPTRNLGLIVIDEEHEGTFKQETVPRYHARDVAVKRAQMLGIPVILGSATPALETWRNAQAGRYARLSLSRRVLDRPMPPVELIDLRKEVPSAGNPLGGLSGPLRHAVRRALDDGGQVILLLNRRGYHTFILCPTCGHVLQCPSCDIALTHHKGRRKTICHGCDAERDPPAACPTCAGKLYYGGIGTERLEREVREAFPDVAIARMDSDTTRSAGSHERVLAAFRAGDVRLLLGTQMIAKGLDFPDVTLVGVISADTALHLPDFRAAERTFQLVAQVAGRTGRGDRPGRVLVQTYCPEAAAIRRAAKHDYEGFVADELPYRQAHVAPPYGRLVRLVMRGRDPEATRKALEGLAGSIAAVAAPEVRLRGPAPAPIEKIKDLHRFHLLLGAPTPRPLQAALHRALPGYAPPTGIELAVDVDPISQL